MLPRTAPAGRGAKRSSSGQGPCSHSNHRDSKPPREESRKPQAAEPLSEDVFAKKVPGGGPRCGPAPGAAAAGPAAGSPPALPGLPRPATTVSRSLPIFPFSPHFSPRRADPGLHRGPPSPFSRRYFFFQQGTKQPRCPLPWRFQLPNFLSNRALLPPPPPPPPEALSSGTYPEARRGASCPGAPTGPAPAGGSAGAESSRHGSARLGPAGRDGEEGTEAGREAGREGGRQGRREGGRGWQGGGGAGCALRRSGLRVTHCKLRCCRGNRKS